MSGRRAAIDEEYGLQLSLMPFLDILFATIGIFIVIFAVQARIESEAAREDSADLMIACTEPGQLVLYATRSANPLSFRDPAPLLQALAASASAQQNLVFAHNRSCFGLRHRFERGFAAFSARLEKGANRAIMRLSYRPLGDDPQALQVLLDTWRGEQ